MNNEEKKNEENETPENVPVPEEENQENEVTTNFEEMFNEMNERYLRLYSEFDNYRKRTTREKSEIIKTAAQDVMRSILPVLDDFERAIKANESIEDGTQLKEGFVLIHHKMKQLLQAKGLKPMNIVGTDFDPEISEAIANVPVEDEKMKGKVVEVLENGYYLNDVVIRYAKVIVGQ